MTVTAAVVALVAAVVSISSAQVTNNHSTATQLDASRVQPAGSSSSAGSTAHPRLSAPVPPSSYSSTAAASAAPTSTLPSSSAPVVVLPPAPGPAPAKEDAAAASRRGRAAAAESQSGGGSSPKATPKATAKAAPAAAPAAATDSYAEHGDIANAIYGELNQERAQNGLAALARNGQLNSSAHAHNVAMANTGQFAHQVSGEAALGARISATGYHWSTAGENIAWGSSASVSFAEDLQSQMYNEPPNQPNHRANILSTSFHNVGVDVITDGSGKMWITFDFGS